MINTLTLFYVLRRQKIKYVLFICVIVINLPTIRIRVVINEENYQNCPVCILQHSLRKVA